MKQQVMLDTQDSRNFEYKNDKTYKDWVTSLSAEDIVAALHNYQRRIRILEKAVDELIAEVKSLKHVAR